MMFAGEQSKFSVEMWCYILKFQSCVSAVSREKQIQIKDVILYCRRDKHQQLNKETIFGAQQKETRKKEVEFFFLDVCQFLKDTAINRLRNLRKCLWKSFQPATRQLFDVSLAMTLQLFVLCLLCSLSYICCLRVHLGVVL